MIALLLLRRLLLTVAITIVILSALKDVDQPPPPLLVHAALDVTPPRSPAPYQTCQGPRIPMARGPVRRIA